MKAAVIGSPVSHSLSPAIFGFLASEAKKVENSFTLDYTAQELSNSQLSTFVSSVKETPNFLGFNVTLPHKETILPFLDHQSEEANCIGAVNVVHVNQGSLKGYNTDCFGIEKTLDECQFDPKQKNVLLIGAGGAAKATAYTLGKLGAKQVIVYNPRSTRGQKLASTFARVFPGTSYRAISDQAELALTSFSLVINATPVGMKESADDRTFDFLSTLPFTSNALAFDLIYTPADTLFLKTARACGLKTIGGLPMFVWQALGTWSIWLGEPPNLKRLRTELGDFLQGLLYLRENSLPLFLTGLMGAGKSDVGATLAALSKRTFLDADALIEQAANSSIAEVFERKGESHFRSIEKDIIQRHCKTPASILALGGGALGEESTLRALTQAGILIYLRAKPETLHQRLTRNSTTPDQTAGRPLLKGLSPAEQLQKLTALLEIRAPQYERANLAIDTDLLNPDQVALAIIQNLGRNYAKTLAA